MKYTLVRMKAIGGPGMASANIVKMLKRHADFDYGIIDETNLAQYFREPDRDSLIHIMYTVPFLQKAVVQELPIIAGPNIRWKDTSPQIRQSKTIRRILTLRADPAPRKCNPDWRTKVSFFPPFVDETFFVPKENKKTIDVLTIGKAFHYPAYLRNLGELTLLLKKGNLKHVHLHKYSLHEFREKLSQTKVLAFPSPKESGVCCCHALLEANMMNVPFVVLDKLVPKNANEFDACRGIGVSSIKEMARILPEIVQNYGSYKPRDWTIERYSFQPACERLREIIKLSEI